MHYYSRRPKAFSVIVKSSRRIVSSSNSHHSWPWLPHPQRCRGPGILWRGGSCESSPAICFLLHNTLTQYRRLLLLPGRSVHQLTFQLHNRCFRVPFIIVGGVWSTHQAQGWSQITCKYFVLEAIKIFLWHVEGSLYTGGEALKNLEGREIRPYLDFHIPETNVEGGSKTEENGKKELN